MKRFFIACALIICCIGIAATGIIATDDAFAENIDVTVSLDGGSLLCAYKDAFAYTAGNEITIAKDNKKLTYKETEQFEEFVSLAMNGTHVVALVKRGGSSALWVYSYGDGGINKINYTNKNLMIDKLLALYCDENGNMYAMDENFVSLFNISDETIKTTHTSLSGLFAQADNFAVIEKDGEITLYLLQDGDLYEITKQNFGKDETDLGEPAMRDSFVDIAAADGELLCIKGNSVYAYERDNRSLRMLLESGVNGESRICAIHDDAKSKYFVYVKSDIYAINAYEYDGALNFYSTFDKTQYSHPTEHDIVKMYKTGSQITLYSSPRHLQVLSYLPSDKYILVLNESGEYYYVYYFDESVAEPIFGYIKKTSEITLCPADEKNDIGTYAQVLHPATPIYKYPFYEDENPFDESIVEKIKYASIFDQLVVINNVGRDGSVRWGWYKVGILDDNGEVIYGYVKEIAVSPYTALKAPDLSKTVKLTSEKLGEYIKIYAFPKEDSIVVDEVPEGEYVYLSAKFDKSQEWTQIVYKGKTAYVKTVNVEPGGLTSWQIALAITVPAVAVAITAAVTILYVVRKRKLALKV